MDQDIAPKILYRFPLTNVSETFEFNQEGTVETLKHKLRDIHGTIRKF
jgi:hypothetical protein